ncbi:LPP20 family lipoprotein [Ferrimonas futtsuensis]|uniref:LPP20 family lipoprotein n=1 Tax=Ferrimonas futtsuensis TaxID=364764 RepID=UPI0003FA013E|nr:LPP20 family lipoprotein [Ferrimonas futtsuensis]
MPIRITTFLLILTATACRATPPSWYLEPPKDSADYIYGVGAGINQQGARHQALMDVTSRLQVKVQGSLHTQTQVINGAVASSANQQVRSESSRLTLTNYELYDSAHKDGTHYQLIRVQRAALLQGLKQQLTQKLLEFGRLRTQQASPLLELKALLAHEQDATSARSLIAILQQQKQSLPALDDLRWYEQRLLASKNHRVIAIELEQATEQTHEFLNQWLSNAGFQSSGPSPLATLRFTIQPQPVRELFGQFHVSVKGKFIVEDQGKVLNVKRLSATGVSSLSGEQAKAVAERQMLNQIAEEDIWKLLLSI